MTNESILLENVEILTKIPDKEPFICLYSGGKDSGLALAMACQRAKPVALITCVDKEETLFHGQNNVLTNMQGERMRIPIKYFNDHWKSGIKLARIYRYYKEQGVTTVVFGDLWDIKNANHKIQICKAAGMKACMPLWGLPYDELIEKINEYRVKSVITTIRSALISKQWLGSVFDRNAYEHFKNIGIDAFGENGEFHTTLVDSNIFSSPIKYKFCSSKIVVDKFGEKISADLIYE